MPPSGSLSPVQLQRPSLTDFYDGLEALRASDLRQTRGARADFCRERLQRLEESKAAASVEDQPQIFAEMAIVRMYLAGECLFPDGHKKEAIDEGEIALRDALVSAFQVVIYDCLGSLGSWYLITGSDNQAVVCFQRAIAFAYDPDDINQTKYSEVLRWLGNVWSRHEATLPLARTTAQWRRALDPVDIGTWRDEFIWLIMHRRQEDVESVVAGVPPDTGVEAARCVAAYLALGRYEEAMTAARAGRSLALRLGDEEWSRTFDRILSPEGPALQGR